MRDAHVSGKVEIFLLGYIFVPLEHDVDCKGVLSFFGPGGELSLIDGYILFEIEKRV